MAKKSDGTVKTVFKIEGEAEYTRAVKNMNSELRVLSSEMKEVDSRFDKNEKSMRKLKAQNEVLNKQYDTQTKKVSTLKDAVANSTKAYDNAVDVYNEMVNKFGEQSKEAKKAADNVDKAKDSVTKFSIELNKAQADLNKTEAALKENNKELRNLKNIKLTDLVPDEMVEKVEELQENFKKVTAAANGVASACGKAALEAGKLGANTLKGTLEAGTKALTAYASAASAAAAGIIANTEEFNKATSTLTSSLGLSAEETQKYGEIIKSVYINNFGDGFEDIANTVGLVKQQLSDISDEELQKVVESGYLLRDVYGIDISESIRGANALTKQFGITAEEAYNLIAQGAENGLNQNADLADQIAEYATYYDNLGLSAQDAFNIMTAGAQNGVYQIDKVNDAVKEFSIRAIDGSKTTAEGFAAIGLNAEEMAAIFAEGGEASAAAFTDVINKLAAMDDKVAQDAAGVALFGTQWEDLGAEAVLALGNMGNSIDMTRDKIAEMGETQYYSLSEALTRALKSIEIGDELKTIESKIAKQIPNLTKALNGMFSPETAEESEREFKRIIRDLSEDIGRDIQDMLPVFLNGINSITSSVIEILPNSVMTLLPYLIDGLTQLTTDLVHQMPTLLPQLAQGAVDLFMGIIGGFNTVIAELNPLIPGIINDVTDILVDNLPLMIRTSYQLFIGLINGLTTAAPEILKAVGDLATTAAGEITKGENLNALIQAGIDLVGAIAEGLPEALPKLIDALGKVISDLLNEEVGYDDMKKIGEGLGETLTDAVGAALGVIDSLLGTNLEGWYNDVVDFSKKMGAKIYEALNQEKIASIEFRNKYDSIDTDIMRAANQYMREGYTPEEALEKAKADILDTIEKQAVYDTYLGDASMMESTQKQYEVLLETGQIGNPDYYKDITPYSQTAAYYEQMGKAAAAEKEFSDTVSTAAPATGTTTGNGGNTTTTEINFYNSSPKAVSAQETIQMNKQQAQTAAIYFGK